MTNVLNVSRKVLKFTGNTLVLCNSSLNSKNTLISHSDLGRAYLSKTYLRKMMNTHSSIFLLLFSEFRWFVWERAVQDMQEEVGVVLELVQHFTS